MDLNTSLDPVRVVMTTDKESEEDKLRYLHSPDKCCGQVFSSSFCLCKHVLVFVLHHTNAC